MIFGEDDRRWHSSSAAEYRAVPGARVELLRGVGHTPILEDPSRTAEVLSAFTAPPAGQVHRLYGLPAGWDAVAFAGGGGQDGSVCRREKA